MRLSNLFLGRPLRSSEKRKQELTVATGIPVLALGALASTAYGPEAALTMLVPLGSAGERYFPFITLAVVLQLCTLYLSYRQTQSAYPDGGGAYHVARDNLGREAGVCAAVALLIDYLLNVSVAIASGVGAIVSAVPTLHPYTVVLCLVVLVSMTILNLRGPRESGLTFVIPVFVFIACIAIVIGVGLIRASNAGGDPEPVVPPPPTPLPTADVTTWLLLGVFASGLTAATGVEAVSNGVPLLREPRVARAHRTLTAIAVILALFLLGIGYLAPTYHIVAMNQREPGYQTVLSQLVGAVSGRGAFYYTAIASIFIILTFSAQTSFADFPRVCRLLAEDQFLPRGFAKRGRRLVFSNGIIFLAILSGILLIAFGGVTDRLIPLFAIGAFTAFLFTQVGIAVQRVRKRNRWGWVSLAYNAIGATTTSVALVIIVIGKFAKGAWLVLIVGPALVLLLRRIRSHYDRVKREIEEPLTLNLAPLQPPIAIVPIEGWDRPAEKALRFALKLSPDVIALHISTEGVDTSHLRRVWTEKVEATARSHGVPGPRLEIVPSPYRRIQEPIVDFVRRTEEDNSRRLVAVIVPELVDPRWFVALLHNVEGARLKTQLDIRGGERTFVIYAPWRLRDS